MYQQFELQSVCYIRVEQHEELFCCSNSESFRERKIVVTVIMTLR